MPQSILDPRTARSNGTSWLPVEELPARVRSFGLFPNIADWLPGDVLLLSQVAPDWIHRQITAAQLRGFDEEHARWQHAAVYMGDGYVSEAGTSGVRYASVSNYVGEHLIRVRRDFTLQTDERWRVAIQAVVRLGTPYGFRTVFSVYRNAYSMSGALALRAQFHKRKRTVICSQLYADAFSVVTGRLLSTRVDAPITPAVLSCAPALSDVALHWKTIAESA
jgi:hypothetical protein